jgi:hypothetical protein
VSGGGTYSSTSRRPGRSRAASTAAGRLVAASTRMPARRPLIMSEIRVYLPTSGSLRQLHTWMQRFLTAPGPCAAKRDSHAFIRMGVPETVLIVTKPWRSQVQAMLVCVAQHPSPKLPACSPDASSSPSISTSSADSSRADVMSAPDESDESSRFAAQHHARAPSVARPGSRAAVAP